MEGSKGTHGSDPALPRAAGPAKDISLQRPCWEPKGTVGTSPGASNEGSMFPRVSPGLPASPSL